MIEHQPAFGSLDRCRAAADFGALPPALPPFGHDMAVFAPVHEIRAFTQEHIAKRCMSAVTRTGQHHEIAIDFSGEQHTVAVERQERIFQTGEGFEILGFGYTDRGPVEIRTPDDVIRIFNLDQTRIICITRHIGFAGFVYKLNRLIVNFPIQAVHTVAHTQMRTGSVVFNTEYTQKAAFISNNSTVENTRDTFSRIALDYRIVTVSPYRIVIPGRSVLPGHIGNILACGQLNFFHN
ncbi:hypothetical protein D3C75_891180 [compost metagenome]